MAAKKAPAKKASATNKSASSSAGSKRIAEEKASAKARRDTKGNTGFGRSDIGAGRTSAKSGLQGFGMTKSGVQARAASAFYKTAAKLYPAGTGQSDKYSGLTVQGSYEGQPRLGGKKISDLKASKIAGAAESREKAKYGVVPSSKKKKK